MDTEPAVNPFADRVFREPRQPHASVAGLNDHALGKLLAQFKRLRPDGAAAGPRRALSEPAQLVVSPQPGYGKSHLIGRLFTALESRATLIYVTPFQSASLCWQSVLLRTVQELTFPDRSDAPAAPGVEPPTQLDAFAHGVLAHLVAGLIEQGRVEHPDPAGAAAWLRENPVEAFSLSDPDHPWAGWMRVVFEHYHRDLENELRRAGLQTQSPGWLRVLFRYAASRSGDEARTLALAWLSGQALEPDEAKLLNLRTGELTPADTPDQINELCWRRLMDFCGLAAFYRPFVFCFDQTEAYGHAAGLARAFGTVVAQIHLLAPNQMMVVTANQQPWEETVARHMETADRDRFTPLALEGLNRAQAEELVRLRCKAADVSAAQAGAFLANGWLQGKFPTERNRMGTRQFLQVCSTRWEAPETWWNAQDRAVAAKKAAEGGKGGRHAELADWLDRYADDLARKPRRLGFNPDAFRWLVEDVARGRRDRTVATNPRSVRDDLLPVMWSPPGDGRKVFIGFEAGNNWKRWRSILQEARACCVSSPSSPPLDRPGTVMGKAVLFRTAEQMRVPGARWTIAPEMEAAKKSFFDVVELDGASTAELYAARALYLDAVAGDVPFSPEDVLDFLVTELEPFWGRIEVPLDGVGEEKESARVLSKTS